MIDCQWLSITSNDKSLFDYPVLLRDTASRLWQIWDSFSIQLSFNKNLVSVCVSAVEACEELELFLTSLNSFTSWLYFFTISMLLANNWAFLAFSSLSSLSNFKHLSDFSRILSFKLSRSQSSFFWYWSVSAPRSKSMLSFSLFSSRSFSELSFASRAVKAAFFSVSWRVFNWSICFCFISFSMLSFFSWASNSYSRMKMRFLSFLMLESAMFSLSSSSSNLSMLFQREIK